MIEVVAKTRRQLNRLQKQVSENQGDLEERIATDIANLNRRCKELQNAVDHESLRATHECNGECQLAGGWAWVVVSAVK